ncbi:MAG: DUF305 domain-containing protein [Gemmatimonadaceae bacterium]
MVGLFPRVIAVLGAVAAVGCSSAGRSGGRARAPLPAAHAEANVAASGRYPFTAADIHFMSGMIPHHAQAVLIAGWAPSHGARQDVRLLCERIVVGQRDEIALMQTWLRDRNQPVPADDATHLRMKMDGVEHDMLMPGMLSPEELTQLDRTRGPEFDRLFLMAMIKHHEGAISMVDQLFGSEGAGQDEVVFRFASDVYADQTTEIERMHKMLAAQAAAGRTP